MTRLLFLFALSNFAALAQSTFGEIRGIVRDSQSAAIESGSISATKIATGEVRKTVTDSSGNYVFANLEAGEYEVLIEKQGFRPSKARNLALRAREIVRVDASLEIATQTAEVSVVDVARRLRKFE